LLKIFTSYVKNNLFSSAVTSLFCRAGKVFLWLWSWKTPGVMPQAVQKMVSAKMGITCRQNMTKRNATRLRRATGSSLMGISGNSFFVGVCAWQV